MRNKKDISKQRCLNHENREAVAMCPECKFFYCRECITEHDDRAICAACLKKRAKKKEKRSLQIVKLYRISQIFFGFMATWIFFYYLGKILLAIPQSFHEETFWAK